MSVACTYVSGFHILVCVLLFPFFSVVRLLYLLCLSRVCYTLGRHERRGLFVTLLLFVVDPSGYRAVSILCHNTYKTVNYHPAHEFLFEHMLEVFKLFLTSIFFFFNFSFFEVKSTYKLCSWTVPVAVPIYEHLLMYEYLLLLVLLYL